MWTSNTKMYKMEKYRISKILAFCLSVGEWRKLPASYTVRSGFPSLRTKVSECSLSMKTFAEKIYDTVEPHNPLPRIPGLQVTVQNCRCSSLRITICAGCLVSIRWQATYLPYGVWTLALLAYYPLFTALHTNKAFFPREKRYLVVTHDRYADN
jgi:hypothetical protein